MRVGLIDVDNFGKPLDKIRFPNIPLMKLSAWHKARGDEVEWWWTDMIHYDRVYMSKVFSNEYTKDVPAPLNADDVIRGGTGYCIRVDDGREVFDEDRHTTLPDDVEHIYPDYGLYGITDTAYGFTSRGCPRSCSFCIVSKKEGCRSRKVADLSEFWDGQKQIQLCDPNTLACHEWRDILDQLADSRARVEFNQGVDIRMMTEDKAVALNRIRLSCVHFAWDNPNDDLKGKFETYAKVRYKGQKGHGWAGTVYCLTNFNSTMEENLYRIYTLRELGYRPYVMVYQKNTAPADVRKLQRWVNNPYIFYATKTFEEYLL